MIMEIGYHWSPRENRDAIQREGLKVGVRAILYRNPATGEDEAWRAPYICTSPSPSKALKYVKARFDDDTPDMDLYEVRVSPEDKVKIRNDMRREILEVRIYNSIPPNRVIYLATREEEED